MGVGLSAARQGTGRLCSLPSERERGWGGLRRVGQWGGVGAALFRYWVMLHRYFTSSMRGRRRELQAAGSRQRSSWFPFTSQECSLDPQTFWLVAIYRMEALSLRVD